MTNFQGKFISLILIGRHNPQILTHDFLMKNSILPESREPFQSLLTKSVEASGIKPFTEFISTPVLTTLKYGTISIVAEEGRFQIRDDLYTSLSETPILSLARRYFETLQHTPITVVGINLNGIINFTDEEGVREIDKAFGITKDSISAYAGTPEVNIGITAQFPWQQGAVSVSLQKIKDMPLSSSINFNYEFECNDIASFIDSLNSMDQVSKKFDSLLEFLVVEKEL